MKTVKTQNKNPSEVQITAEQILREARDQSDEALHVRNNEPKKHEPPAAVRLRKQMGIPLSFGSSKNKRTKSRHPNHKLQSNQQTGFSELPPSSLPIKKKPRQKTFKDVRRINNNTTYQNYPEKKHLVSWFMSGLAHTHKQTS